VMAPLINMVMMPVLLLSGILLPMTIGPDWLQRVSDFMPFRWIVDAVRDTFVGEFSTGHVFWGTTWTVGLFALAIWWGTAVFRKENA
jgi:ABC-2 type transport system permease protein